MILTIALGIVLAVVILCALPWIIAGLIWLLILAVPLGVAGFALYAYGWPGFLLVSLIGLLIYGSNRPPARQPPDPLHPRIMTWEDY